MKYYDLTTLNNAELHFARAEAYAEADAVRDYHECLEGLQEYIDHLLQWWQEKPAQPMWVKHAWSVGLSLVNVLQGVENTENTLALYIEEIDKRLPEPAQMSLDAYIASEDLSLP